MSRVRYVIAAASVLVVIVGMGIVVAINTPEPGSHYVPGSLPALADGAEVGVTEISTEGLQEPGALDPVPAEGHSHDDDATPGPGPEPSAAAALAHDTSNPALEGAEMVALTSALPIDADQVYVMGVTWDSTDAVGIDARYLDDDGWGDWQGLGIDGGISFDDGAEDEGETSPGTEPFIVSEAAAIQVRASSNSGVPSALTVSMFTGSGTEQVDAELNPRAAAFGAGGAGGVGTSIGGLPEGPQAAPQVALAGPVDNPMPTIHLRNEWNPRSPSGEFVLGTVRGIAVHHTAGNNSYSKSDVPGILRAIQRYHMDSRDWYDIGYNFLIDKYGRIWEGRGGGILNTYKGVHSHSFNGLVTGVSLMGNFSNHTPSKASRDALVDFMAWKLTLHGVSADGRILHTGEGAFPGVIGHRDIPEAATACPGWRLYDRLDRLQERTIEKQGLPALPLDTDVTGDGVGDFLHVNGDSAVVYTSGAGPAIATSPFAGKETLTRAVSQYDAFAAGPPLDGDPGTEILARRSNDGLLFRMEDRGVAKLRLGVATNLTVPSGRLLASPGDLTGDGDPDVVLVNSSTGVVAIHPGDGDGVLGTPTSVDPGTGAVTAVAAVGDANDDGDLDLAVIDDAGAVIYLLGDGAGGLTAQATEAPALANYDELAVAGDLTGDGFDDLLARRSSSGAVVTLAGGAFGLTGESYTWDSGVATWQHPMGAPGWGGDPGRTLLAVSTNGQYVVVPTPGSAELAFAPSDITIEVDDLRSASIVGDYDGDGFPEAMTLDGDGELRLHFGSAGGFDGSVVVPDPYGGGGWEEYLAVTAVGDYNFDGTPDLAVNDIDGDVLVFTWDPVDPTVLGGPRRVRWQYENYSVVGVGAWSGEGISDLLMVSPGGSVDILSGKGMTGTRRYARDVADLPANAQIIPLGHLPGMEGGAVLIYNPSNGSFTAYGWTSGDDWAALPQITVTG